MPPSLPSPFFLAFSKPVDTSSLPKNLILMSGNKPHPQCLLAAEDLQNYLRTQSEWNHNFGLVAGQEGAVVGKMFGVLVVQSPQNETGYLAAFSGKLAGSNHHSKFVPPVFDSLSDESFLNQGMAELKLLSQKLISLTHEDDTKNENEINSLKVDRKKYSSSLQKQLFDQYHFLNCSGEKKSLNEIFKTASYKNPPSGAGECAAPKLLQHAFQNNMKPLALAEFWWGQSPKSSFWKHRHFYPCCREKCEPILAHMLGKSGMSGTTAE